ncbi:hypothetical protein C8F04DRAFT_511511 [Mycena alexandri]|uniref:Uncharacterized protein n=1 Tax=Mycena alexandri TaxID=1745969 RepID=A0AAD6SXC1_9AGAR|nr:hypothetical protein C8F04DRAFT_511511 [Mycena alexandri]
MLKRTSKLLPLLQRRFYPAFPTPLPETDSQVLADWINSPKHLTLTDTLSVERLSDLYITLPTRDGSQSPYEPPKLSEPLPYGSHLVFFHPRNPESALRRDGSDPEFCPPKPFTRRMWAGGSITWDNDNPLLVGESAVASSTVTEIEEKVYKSNTLVFVTQTIEITMVGKTRPSVVEQRSHAYIATLTETGRLPREFRGLPTTFDFSFKFTPTPTTLFRFSALTFNAHHIHLDANYARFKEHYKERLVHGPLTALMMLEVARLERPDAQFANFKYRARNPFVVNRSMAINGVWQDKDTLEMWCVDKAGVVGMTGSLQLVAK